MLLYYIMWSMPFSVDTLRIGGRNWSEYLNQVPGKILSSPTPSKEPPDTIIYRTSHSHTMNRLLLLDLMSASNKDDGISNIYLSRERILKTKLSKSRGKDGKLKIYKLSDFELQQVRSVLDSLPSSLLNKGDIKPIIVYTGCSRSVTGFIDDFLEGNLV